MVKWMGSADRGNSVYSTTPTSESNHTCHTTNIDDVDEAMKKSVEILHDRQVPFAVTSMKYR